MRGPDGEDAAGVTTFAGPPETGRSREQGTGASLLARKQVRRPCVGRAWSRARGGRASCGVSSLQRDGPLPGRRKQRPRGPRCQLAGAAAGRWVDTPLRPRPHAAGHGPAWAPPQRQAGPILAPGQALGPAPPAGPAHAPEPARRLGLGLGLIPEAVGVSARRRREAHLPCLPSLRVAPSQPGSGGKDT